MKTSRVKEYEYHALRKDDSENENENSSLLSEWDHLDIITFILKCLLWCSLMAFFVTLEFGAVFFIVSAFYLMFTNFRKTKKEAGEKSAYSVFNPNCEAINGTLTAQQFENEIKFGIGSLH